MAVSDLFLFQALRARLDQLGERQRLIAENLANVATPGFTPRDVDDQSFRKALAAAAPQAGALPLARTHPGHLPSAALTGAGAMPTPRVISSPDAETTIDGNRVVLEDQLIKAGETRAAFETGLAIYQKGLQLLRLAARGPR